MLSRRHVPRDTGLNRQLLVYLQLRCNSTQGVLGLIKLLVLKSDVFRDVVANYMVIFGESHQKDNWS